MASAAEGDSLGQSRGPKSGRDDDEATGAGAQAAGGSGVAASTAGGDAAAGGQAAVEAEVAALRRQLEEVTAAVPECAYRVCSDALTVIFDPEVFGPHTCMYISSTAFTGPICLDVVEYPVELDACHHLFCCNCIYAATYVYVHTYGVQCYRSTRSECLTNLREKATGHKRPTSARCAAPRSTPHPSPPRCHSCSLWTGSRQGAAARRRKRESARGPHTQHPRQRQRHPRTTTAGRAIAGSRTCL